ncbi:cytochrome P450 [Sorangium sp. So ce1335]|uniref:cytochrome P450 n=1 Tax=Sorangium sp. So ce1335 TaxID=3133335 RepID=UPI003F5F9953
MPILPSPPRAEAPRPLGNLPRLLRDPLGVCLECARRYGDIVDLGVPLSPTYLVSRPDLIEHLLVEDHRSYIKDRTTRDLSEILGDGLVTSEGDRWRRMRRLVQPGFHRERVASYGAVMVELTERMLDAWAPGQERDAHADMMALTREIVARVLFSADVASDAAQVSAAVQGVVQRFSDIPPGVPLLRQIPSPGKRRFDRAMQTLEGVIYRIIAGRRASGRDAGDLLSMLMAARDEAGAPLPDRQLRDEVMTLFLAGHETTAAALSWTWVLLARHPEIRARLLRELDEVLGGRAPTVADVPRLRFTEQVLLESMRILPPVWSIAREAIVSTTLGGYAIPRGAQLWILQYVVHRDPRYYEDPEAFRPERWEGDLQRRLPRYAYLPFGGGPRVCIGNAFAMMEAVLLLATIARRYTLDLVPGHRVTPEPVITLRPKHGVRVSLTRTRAAPPAD